MPAVFTNWMLQQFALNRVTGAAITFNSVRYGTRPANQVVDATAEAIALQDPNPAVVTADIIAPTARGTTVQHRLNINSTGSPRQITEVGLFVGANLGIYEADANTVLVDQTATDNVLKALAYQILQDGTPTGLSLELLGAQRTELYSNDNYAWGNDQVKSFALSGDWTEFDFLDIYVEGPSNERNLSEFVSVASLELQEQMTVGQAWDSATNRAVKKISKSTGAGELLISQGASVTELRAALDQGAGVTGKFTVHGVKYQGLKGDQGDPPPKYGGSNTPLASANDTDYVTPQDVVQYTSHVKQDGFTTITQAAFDARTVRTPGRLFLIPE